MKRMKTFLIVITFVLFFLALFFIFKNNSESRSYPQKKVGVIIFSKEFEDSFRGFSDGVKKYNYLDVEFQVVNIDGDLTKVEPALELFHQKSIKIILATTTPVNQKIKELNDKYGFYVIFTQVASPLESGLTMDEKSSGTNFVGVSRVAFVTLAKRMEIFKDAFPELKRVIIFYGPNEKFLEKHLAQYKDIAGNIGLELYLLPLIDEKSIDDAQKLVSENTGVFMAPSPYSVKYFSKIRDFADRNRIPIMAIDTYLVQKGATLAYSQSFYNDGVQASYYLFLTLKGIEPKNLPILRPDKMELYLNRKSITNTKMKFNKSYFGYADRIVE
ncbi:ABC transporter substrate binding protein [Calditerrivibrio nitroreducens]|jgi:putative ABC transport system substrate-binding protein|uniref:ABC transporter substrate binding protein n=1 Tax=Calditerrivibrio nitroreducens TaxID=477976 RepID=UPI003C7747F2